MNSTSGRTAFFAVVAAITLLSGTFAWQNSRSPPLPAGFVVGGGRLESVEIDVTTKAAGRIKEILVKKGERVDPGQVVARMDTQPLEAELQQLQSRVKQTGSSPVGIAMAPQKTEDRSGARAVLAQKRQAKAAAMASMTLIESEAAFAESELKRSEELVAKGFLTAPRLQADRSRAETAKSALNAARSKLAEAQAAIEAAQASVPDLPPAIRASESAVADPESSTEEAMAAAEKIRADIDDATLRTPRGGRVQSLVSEPGEMLPAGGKVLTVVDPADVSMTFFLPEGSAGKVAIGSEVRLVLDAVPQYVIPARLSAVDGAARFTAAETSVQRHRLAFRSKAQIDPALLRKCREQLKAGLPGVAYVRLDNAVHWPEYLQLRLPQ